MIDTVKRLGQSGPGVYIVVNGNYLTGVGERCSAAVGASGGINSHFGEHFLCVIFLDSMSYIQNIVTFQNISNVLFVTHIAFYYLRYILRLVTHFVTGVTIICYFSAGRSGWFCGRL